VLLPGLLPLGKGILWEARGNNRSSVTRMAPARRSAQSAAPAPPWSWASVKGCVSWPRYTRTLDGLSCQYLFEISALEPPVNASTYIASHSALLIRGVIKKCLSLISTSDSTPTVEFRDYAEPSAFDLKLWDGEIHAEVGLSELYYCYLLQATETLAEGLQCLILEPMHQEESKVFRRIGVCETRKAWAEDFFAGIDETDLRIC
jgi:hypothetical protein